MAQATLVKGALRVKYGGKFVLCHPETETAMITDFEPAVISICRPLSKTVDEYKNENPTVPKGQFAVEYNDDGRVVGMKIGDGETPYSVLPYIHGGSFFDVEVKNSDGSYTPILL